MDQIQTENSAQQNQNSGPLSGLAYRGPPSPDSNDSSEHHTSEAGTVLHEITQEHPEKEGKRERKGRRKINIEFIDDKSRRHITFSKRKSGIMKKAYELATLTGTQVLLLVASETGHVYTFATNKLQPLITKAEGKNLIQACLNAPDMSNGGAPSISMSTSRVNANHNFSGSNGLEGSSFMPSSQEPTPPDQPANFSPEPEEKKMKGGRGQKQELRGLVAAAAGDMSQQQNQNPSQMQNPLSNVGPYMTGPLGMHPIAALNHQILHPNMPPQNLGQNPNAMNQAQNLQNQINQLNQNQIQAQIAQAQGQGMPGQGQMPPGLAMGSSLGGLGLPYLARNAMFYPTHGQFNLGPSFPPGGPNGGPPGWSFKGPGAPGQPHPLLQLHPQQLMQNEGQHSEGNHPSNQHGQHSMPNSHHAQSQHDDDHYNQ